MPACVTINGHPGANRNAMRAVEIAPEKHVVTVTRKFTLAHDGVRARAVRLIEKLTPGWTVKIGAPNRSSDQNALLWTLLTDISRAKPQGRVHPPEVWKCLIMNAHGYEAAFETGLDGKPFPVGFRSSHLKVGEMSELIEFTYAWGAQNGVTFSEQPNPRTKAA